MTLSQNRIKKGTGWGKWKLLHKSEMFLCFGIYIPKKSDLLPYLLNK